MSPIFPLYNDDKTKRTSSQNKQFDNLTIEDLYSIGFIKAEQNWEIEYKYGCRGYYEYYIKEEDDEIIMIYGVDDSDVITEIL